MCELPPDLFVSGEDLFVGLGWNTRCDLDAGMMLVDKDATEGARAINIVNFCDKVDILKKKKCQLVRQGRHSEKYLRLASVFAWNIILEHRPCRM